MASRRPARYLAVLLVVGSLAVFLVEGLLCRWPPPHPLSATEAILTAISYVFCAVLSGALITRCFWYPSRLASSASLTLFTIASAVGWSWIPCVVLLSRQRSILAVPVAMMVAVAMATGLRRVVASSSEAPSRTLLKGESGPPEMFAEFLSNHPRERYGPIIAVCLYAALFALHRNAFSSACFLVALCAFLLTWKLRSDSDDGFVYRESRLNAGLRLARIAATAVLITTGLLLLGLAHGAASGSLGVYAVARRTSGVQTAPPGRSSLANLLGFERIVLWPAPEKKEMIVPAPRTTSATGFNLRKPLTIRFDGAYWYFHPRGDSLGARAHVTHGDPLTVNIRSTNYIPLVMEAHQNLAAPIPLSCCSEIGVTIENRDNAPGLIALGVLLTDSTSLGKPTFYLDQQTIPSTEPGRFTVKSSAAPEVLNFRIPSRPRIQQFDEITVIFFPDAVRPNAGVKIAIKQFDLIPR